LKFCTVDYIQTGTADIDVQDALNDILTLYPNVEDMLCRIQLLMYIQNFHINILISLKLCNIHKFKDEISY
jgi:hypothetical protein